MENRYNKFLNWKTALLIGACLPLLARLIIRLVNPPVPEGAVRVAKLFGAEPRIVEESEQLIFTADEKGTLSDKEWKQLKGFFYSKNDHIRKYAVSAMMSMGKSKYRREILTITRPLLLDKPLLQRSAVLLLWRLNETEWRTQAVARRNHEDKDLRELAQNLLTRGDLKAK